MKFKNTSRIVQVQQLRVDGLDQLVIAERTGLTPRSVQVYCSYLNKAGGDAQLASRLKSIASESTRRCKKRQRKPR